MSWQQHSRCLSVFCVTYISGAEFEGTALIFLEKFLIWFFTIQVRVSNGLIQFESARKILPLLELDESLLAHARMLRFSLKFPCRVALTIICILDTGHNVSCIENWKSIGKYAGATNVQYFCKNSSPVY